MIQPVSNIPCPLGTGMFVAFSNLRSHCEKNFALSRAVPAWFIHNTMNNSLAKRQAVILDCCFSGAFDPSLRAKDDGSFDLKGQLGSEGRVVLASSSSTQYSFEQKKEELSIFTRYLVEGIETGDGDVNKDGKISILELHEYATRKVQEELPHVTPKIIVLKDKGFEICLSKVKKNIEKTLQTTKERVYLEEVILEDIQNSREAADYSPVPSLLQSMNPLLERLIEHLNSHCLSQTQDNKSLNLITTDYALEIIRLASDATFVFLMRNSQDQNTWNLSAQSSLDSTINASDYAEIIRNEILYSTSSESIFTTGHHGIYKILHNEKAVASESVVLIPVVLSNYTEFIVICGLLQESLYLNDAYTRIVSSFYQATQESYSLPSRIEAYLLDNLKREYGFIPISFYNRRFELFCERLSQMVIYFEPVLDIKSVSIVAWEALARDPQSMTAPVDLFEAAELWGREFTLELDVNLLKLAVTSYRQSASRIQKNRPSDLSPLSVNVYPESLMRTVYFETVRKLTTEDENGNITIPADSLILEISEKAELPPYQDGIRLRSPVKAFKEKLIKYAQDLEIRFSIDDFGVGYASVDRLAELNAPYVKIDRNILHQPQADIIIRFVREVVAHSAKLHSAKIIVEGLDEASPVSLNRLKQLGVSLVQGYVIGEAGPDIYRLTTEKYDYLKALIRGDSD